MPVSGAFLNWCPLVQVSEDDMRSHGLDLLLAEFREFPTRDSNARSVPSRETADGRRDAKIRRESVPIFVTLLQDGTIEFIPCARWSRSAWIHLSDSVVTIKRSAMSAEFFDAISTAFERCRPDGNSVRPTTKLLQGERADCVLVPIQTLLSARH
jgi:hypothetical protein